MPNIHSQYKNKLAGNVETDVAKIVINDTDEFTTGITFVTNSNICTVSLLLTGYVNANITNIKIYDSGDVLMADLTVDTAISANSYSDQFDFTFTVV